MPLRVKWATVRRAWIRTGLIGTTGHEFNTGYKPWKEG
jgi:hypothetical protein